MATTPKGFFRLLPLIDTQPSTPKGMIHSVSSPIFLAENSQALQKEGAGEALRADTYCLKVSDFGGCVGDAETRRVASQKLTSSITSAMLSNHALKKRALVRLSEPTPIVLKSLTLVAASETLRLDVSLLRS